MASDWSGRRLDERHMAMLSELLLFGLTKFEPGAIPPSKTGKMAAGFEISSPIPIEMPRIDFYQGIMSIMTYRARH